MTARFGASTRPGRARRSRAATIELVDALLELLQAPPRLLERAPELAGRRSRATARVCAA
ncbi:MAG TPA: hypothetical protein VNO30_09990 [Kofleriaceae bacterium]|nr:hypothetical protein [Kofleriaceae bacterium]